MTIKMASKLWLCLDLAWTQTACCVYLLVTFSFHHLEYLPSKHFDPSMWTTYQWMHALGVTRDPLCYNVIALWSLPSHTLSSHNTFIPPTITTDGPLYWYLSFLSRRVSDRTTQCSTMLQKLLCPILDVQWNFSKPDPQKTCSPWMPTNFF
jgi:hypothetical protein